MSISSDTTCPFCGAAFAPGSAACPACDLPLLVEGGDSEPPFGLFDGEAMIEPGERDDSLRRRPRVGMLAIEHPPPKPEYSQGELRCVVVALNQAEAEMLEDMLRAEGIPCLVRRMGRADVPDFLAAGRREVLVPERALAAARELLRIDPETSDVQLTSPTTLAFALLAGIALVILCVGLVVGLT
ncbi:MAG: DUF2007 domain-containing protein [Solirubrobacterales bacterium]